jgi:hypothetical protein
LPQDAAISLGETTFRHRQLMALTKGNYCAHISPTLGPSRSERAPLTLGSLWIWGKDKPRAGKWQRRGLGSAPVLNPPPRVLRRRRAAQEPTDLGPRLAIMSLLSFICRLRRCPCEPPRPEQTTATATSADLGQKEAKNEALRQEQLRHMEGGQPARSAQEQKARKRPR